MFAWLDAYVRPIAEQLYATFGYLGVVLAVAIESIIVPIPSELILPLAGFSVARGVSEPLTGTAWSFWGAVAAGVVGSTIGALAAYAFGRYAGRAFIVRWGRYVLVTADDLAATEAWFARYGDAAVFFGRMVPMVRSLISVPAGLTRMNLVRFTLFSAAGALPWTILLVWGGMQVGEHWPMLLAIMKRVEYAVIALIVLAAGLFAWRRLRR